MEFYTLNDLLQKDVLIQGFGSFIWTERYFAYGDFQIVTQSTYISRTLLSPGTFITRQGSQYVMVVDTVSDDTTDDGTRNLTITGKALEALFMDRVAMPAVTDTTTQPNWVLTGTPGNIIRYMFNQICVSCVLDEHDTVPFYTFGTLNPAGSIPEPADSVTITLQPDTLYNSIVNICTAYNIGFRLVRNAENSQIFFEVYMGNDLTTEQTILAPVVFDPNMDTLQDMSILTSTASLKTVAYVYAENGSTIVLSPNSDPDAYDVGRRVLLINSANSDPAGAALTMALQQEGMMALAQQQTVYSFDGTLPALSPYTYGVDYNLGDLVEERNSDGISSQMLVTEQIFSSDDTGETSYPTLVLSQTVVSDSWLAFDPDATWSSIDQAVDWADI